MPPCGPIRPAQRKVSKPRGQLFRRRGACSIQGRCNCTEFLPGRERWHPSVPSQLEPAHTARRFIEGLPSPALRACIPAAYPYKPDAPARKSHQPAFRFPPSAFRLPPSAFQTPHARHRNLKGRKRGQPDVYVDCPRLRFGLGGWGLTRRGGVALVVAGEHFAGTLDDFFAQGGGLEDFGLVAVAKNPPTDFVDA